MINDAPPRTNLPNTYEEAIAMIYELLEVQKELLKNISDLKEQLNLNSKNSSLPPSKDRKNSKERKKSSFKKRGGQLGHKGHRRELFQESEVSNIVECEIASICDCGGEISEKEDSGVKQVVEIPSKIPFEITQYNIKKGRCKKCSKRYSGRVPAGTPKGVCGPNLLSLMSILTTRYRMSKRLAHEFINERFGIPISLGTISHSESLVSEALKECYEELVIEVQNSPVKNIDETGFKINHKNGWLWAMATSEVSVFALCGSRGKKMAQSLLGENHGFVISDRYGAYSWIEDDKRQLCLAHIIRDFTRISERNHPISMVGKRLLVAIKTVFTLWGNWLSLPDTKSPFYEIPEFVTWKDYIKRLLQEAVSSDCQKSSATCNRILGKFDSIWTFTKFPGVEPTNNHAERILRPAVIYKKLCFGVDSKRGARFLERILSVIQTTRLKKINPFDFIAQRVKELLLKNSVSLTTILRGSHLSTFAT